MLFCPIHATTVLLADVCCFCAFRATQSLYYSPAQPFGMSQYWGGGWGLPDGRSIICTQVESRKELSTSPASPHSTRSPPCGVARARGFRLHESVCYTFVRPTTIGVQIVQKAVFTTYSKIVLIAMGVVVHQDSVVATLAFSSRITFLASFRPFGLGGMPWIILACGPAHLCAFHPMPCMQQSILYRYIDTYIHILRGCAHGRAAHAEARGEQFLSMLRPLNSLKISKR